MSQQSRLLVFTMPGSVVNVWLFEDEARDIFNKWKSGWFKEQGHETIGQDDCEGPWCIRLDQICAIQMGQTADSEALKRQAEMHKGNYSVSPREGRQWGQGKPDMGSGLPPHLRPKGF